MKMTQLRLVGLTTIDLPLFGLTAASRYILKAVDGLGPPEIDVSISNGLYQGRKPHPRQVVARIGLNPDWNTGQTPGDLRSELYGILAPGIVDSVSIEIMDGATVKALTTGYVSKMEIVPFSKEPEVQVTLECESAYLKSPTEITVVPTTKASFTIDNEGDAPTPFYMEITMTAAKSVWALYNRGLQSLPRMRWDYAFLAGDKLSFNTRLLERNNWITRAGTTTPRVDLLYFDSIWFQLHNGVNTFHTWDSSFDWGLIKYTPRYWGI